MKLRNALKLIVASCAVFNCMASGAAVTSVTDTLVAMRAAKGTPVTTGQWHAGLAETKAYAESNGIPLIAVWSNGDSCPHCTRFENCVMSTPFVNWMKTSGCAFMFAHSKDPSPDGDVYPSDLSKPFHWCWGYGSSGYKKASLYPFVRIYWVKDGRTLLNVCTDGDTVDAKQGLVGGTPTNPEYHTYNPGGRACVNYISNALANAGYDFSGVRQSYAGGRFIPSVATNTATSHIEIDVANPVSTVPVKLYRESTGVYTNYMVYTFPGQSQQRQAVVWDASATNKTVSVTVPRDLANYGGRKVSLSLLNATNGLEQTSSIWLVNNPENGSANPFWIGERNASTLAAGEWTMDINMAKTWAQNHSSYVFIYNGGPLWCPDCWSVESNLLEVATFKRWAVSRNLALVEIDQPRKERTSPTLLNDELAPNGWSGLAYKTRKGISDADGERIRNRNLAYTTSTWKLPGSTAWRLSNPTFLVMRPNGTIMGRTEGYETSTRDFPVAANIARFDEMLRLAGDSTEEVNGEISTTPLAIGKSGTSSSQTLSAVDTVDVWRVSDAAASLKYTATVTGSSSKKVKVSVVSIVGSATNVLGSATGVLSSGVAASGNLSTAGSVYVKVEADGTTFSLDSTSDTTTPYTLSMSNSPDCGTLSFTTARVSALETDGSVTLQVSRTGGTYGVASVTVAVDPTSTAESSRYSVPNATLTWAAGTSGAKSLTLRLLTDGKTQGDQNLVLKLVAASGNQATVSSAKATVAISDSANPNLGPASQRITLFKDMKVSRQLPAYNLEGGVVSLKKVSGALPRGVSMRYDPRAGKVLISGTPRVPGTYVATYRLDERAGGEYRQGDATAFTFVVANPRSYNAAIGVRTAYSAAPLYASVLGTNVLAGTLEMTLDATGRARAKYASAAGKVSFNGSVTSLDPDTGTAIVAFGVNRGKTLAMSIARDGRATVSLTDRSNEFGTALTGTLAINSWTRAAPASAYVGYYTVTLPVEDSRFDSAKSIAGAPSGTGYLVLTINSANAMKGQVKYKGHLANGKSFSGTAALIRQSSSMSIVPIFYKSGSESLGVVIAMKANAATIYRSEPCVVTAAEGVCSWWKHTEYSGFNYMRGVGVYGAYYSGASALESDCIVEVYDTERMTFEIGELDTPSASYGTVKSVPTASVTVDNRGLSLSSSARGMTLSFNRTTGVISGRIPVTFAGNRVVAMNYQGVVMPGWWDCGCSAESIPNRPFASGAAYFRDAYHGSTVVRGVSIDLTPAN